MGFSSAKCFRAEFREFAFIFFNGMEFRAFFSYTLHFISKERLDLQARPYREIDITSQVLNFLCALFVFCQYSDITSTEASRGCF